jgi:membrane protein implicated in regulation of membrane protease activity
MPKTAQFIVAGILVLYIVFATRPAPHAISTLLASPIAQLAALAGVVYLGSSVSLLVAVLAALAVVLSIPAREYFKEKDEKIPEAAKKTDKDTESTAEVKDAVQSLIKTAGKKDVPPPAPLPTGSKSEKKSEKKGGSDKEPEAAADKVVSSEGGSGSEKFSLRDAAPF